MREFIGRREELECLHSLGGKKTASFVVIRGRRRIGKSRLIEEFGRTIPHHIFSGLPPTEQTSAKTQLAEFCRQLAKAFDWPPFEVDNWGDAFLYLGKQCAEGRIMIALDEISWIGSKDPDFLGHLKNAWDLCLSKNPEFILIVCGSVSSWITKNILSSTGFVGRISIDLQLKELPIHEAVAFWDGKRDRIASYEIVKILSVTGGVPRYLEELKSELSAEENIRELCFTPKGLLFREFDQIFSTLFSSRASDYIRVIHCLADGPRVLQELGDAVGQANSTVLSYLKELGLAGFIKEDPTWNLKTMKTSNLKRYRLSDNYLRFYLKCVA